ncbi:hypothetical protein DSECCO2_77960 [anaerobic digester metagenome]
MDILKRKRTSKCTSGALVYEYFLSDPIDSAFIALLGGFGSVEKRELGGLLMFTFQKDDCFTLKGILDDVLFYATYQRSYSKVAEKFIDNFITSYNISKAKSEDIIFTSTSG